VTGARARPCRQRLPRRHGRLRPANRIVRLLCPAGCAAGGTSGLLATLELLLSRQGLPVGPPRVVAPLEGLRPEVLRRSLDPLGLVLA